MTSDLLRISITGALPSGEEWSVNPVFGLADFGEPVTQAQVQTIATALAAMVIPNLLMITMINTTTINGYRVEARKKSGELQALAEAVKVTPEPGTGTNAHPFQTSIVSSLRTAQVGASGRGRLYWPATGFAISSTNLRPSDNNVGVVRDAVKSYLSGMQTIIRATLPGAYLAVWSRKQQGLYAVNSIGVGNVLDVQRRRRDALFEAYFATSYP